jgi:hypothetical protein
MLALSDGAISKLVLFMKPMGAKLAQAFAFPAALTN